MQYDHPKVGHMLHKQPDLTPESLETVLGRKPIPVYNRNSDRTDPLACYLKEVGYKPLLTFEEECALAERIANHDEKARNELIVKNLRLVIKISRHYLYRGIPLSDLIEEGNLGLMHAVTKFDPKKECRFSTYATWWIQESIEKAIMNTSHTIRIPIHIAKAVNKLKGIYRKLSQKMEKAPNISALAAAADMSIAEVGDLLQVSKMDYLETLYYEKEEAFGKEMAGNSISKYNQLELNIHVLRDLITTLPVKEQEVLIRRFGLDGEESETLDKIAVSLRITREHVRQIQLRGLKSLRKLMEKEGLTYQAIFDI